MKIKFKTIRNYIKSLPDPWPVPQHDSVLQHKIDEKMKFKHKNGMPNRNDSIY